jgi:hypothetical protein
VFRARATAGARPEYLEFLKAHPRHLHDKSMVPRVARAGTVVHIPDVELDSDFQFQGVNEARGRPARSLLGVPLLRNGTVEGVFVVSRHDVKPFTQRQIELVEAFSDQAVIAIENVRLFDEVQAKTRDLEESLQQQTATSEVLQVISSSPGDLAPVFDKMLESATRVCGAEFGSMYLVEGRLITSGRALQCACGACGSTNQQGLSPVSAKRDHHRDPNQAGGSGSGRAHNCRVPRTQPKCG